MTAQESKRSEEQQREKLKWQTGAFLNGYVSCKVKRWYSFHKFLVERFLGYVPMVAAGGTLPEQQSTCAQVPQAPRPTPPVGQGLKMGQKIGASAAPEDGREIGERRSISVQEMVDAMPVVLFLHVVGCGEHVPGLEELVTSDAIVGSCSADVRKLLFRQHEGNHHTKMVRRRMREAMEALDSIGLLETTLAGETMPAPASAHSTADAGKHEQSADTSAAGGAEGGDPEGGGDSMECVKEKDATVHSATSFVVQRRVEVVFENEGGRNVTEGFVFDREEDIDNFWRTVAVKSRSHMQPGGLVKHECNDDYDSDEGESRGTVHGAGGRWARNAPLFEKFPMLKKRKTWSNLAFGDCTAVQREAVASMLARESMTAADQVPVALICAHASDWLCLPLHSPLASSGRLHGPLGALLIIRFALMALGAGLC